MSTVKHNLQTESEGIHQIHNWTYANAAARTAATGFIADDLYKIALEETPSPTLWMLTAVTPTWIQISGSSSVTNFTDLTDVPASYVGAGGYAVAVNGGENGLEFVPFPTGNNHTVEDAITAAVTDVVELQHNSTGTPAAGFGTGIAFQGESNTTPDQPMAQIASKWVVATHATRRAAIHLYGYRQTDKRELAVFTTPLGPTGTVGNARAQGSVDLQTHRILADQITGGNYSAIVGGFSNKIETGYRFGC